MMHRCVIATVIFSVVNFLLSSAAKEFRSVKPHSRKIRGPWPTIRVKRLQTGSEKHRDIAAFVHLFEEPKQPEVPPDQLENRLRSLGSIVHELPTKQLSKERSAKETEAALKIARQAVTQAEEDAISRRIEGLARSADALSDAINQKQSEMATAKVEKKAAAAETAKQAEISAREAAAEKAVDKQQEAQQTAEKIEMEEKEKEVEAKERIENEAVEAKMSRQNELERAKELIEGAKEKAEEKVEKKEEGQIEKRMEKEAERTVKEEEKVAEEAAQAVEAEGIMEDKTTEKKLLEDQKAHAEAIVAGSKADAEAQRELEHRKKLEAGEASAAEQEKIKQETSTEGNVIEKCNLKMLFCRRNSRRAAKKVSPGYAQRFLRTVQRAGYPAIQQEVAEAAASEDYGGSDGDYVDKKATVGAPAEEHGAEEGHGEAKKEEEEAKPAEEGGHAGGEAHGGEAHAGEKEGHAGGGGHKKKAKGLTTLQWVYLGVLFPAGVTLAALSLVLFI